RFNPARAYDSNVKRMDSARARRITRRREIEPPCVRTRSGLGEHRRAELFLALGERRRSHEEAPLPGPQIEAAEIRVRFFDDLAILNRRAPNRNVQAKFGFAPRASRASLQAAHD